MPAFITVSRRICCCLGFFFSMLAATAQSLATNGPVLRIPRRIWKGAALDHQEKIRALLGPTLLPKDANPNTGRQRRQPNSYESWFTALDPKNPVCNFLIEYYGLKGVKGPKRLARWSPSPNLLFQQSTSYTDAQALIQASRSSANKAPVASATPAYEGVLLEDVSEEDLATLLQMRGAILEDNGDDSETFSALYSPFLWMNTKLDDSDNPPKSHPSSAFLWYRAILENTLVAEPVLHCHGLHEWAMQYHPEGAPPPPSAKYQAHLNLRVPREVINETVERKGISCTHVDALRFFAPAAGPLNHHGASLKRMDQVRLEQPACVHAQMDLLKIALRLQPFCDAELLQKTLQLSMDARRLDVAASPYDATAYGVGVVPVETQEGRAQYRKEQRVLMERAEPIRKELLDAYNTFLALAFGEDPDELEARVTPDEERYAKAEPGGKPWRKNLISATPP